MYIRNNISQPRRQDLEQANTHIIVIDINLKQKFRLINEIRTLSPPNILSQGDHFKNQLDIIKHVC